MPKCCVDRTWWNLGPKGLWERAVTVMFAVAVGSAFDVASCFFAMFAVAVGSGDYIYRVHFLTSASLRPEDAALVSAAARAAGGCRRAMPNDCVVSAHYAQWLLCSCPACLAT